MAFSEEHRVGKGGCDCLCLFQPLPGPAPTDDETWPRVTPAERRQTGSSCFDTEGRRGSCVNIRSCAPLAQLLQQAKRGGAARSGALNRLRQETFRCPFSRGNPLVCCATGQLPASRTTSGPLIFFGNPPTRRTTQRPQVFTNPPTRRTTPRPQQFFTNPPTRRTTPRPQQFFTNPPTRRTTPRPQQFFTNPPTRRTTQRPQVFTNPPTQRTTPRPQEFSSLPGEDQCGRRTFGSRIIGGEDAEIGSWPWAASIGYRSKHLFCSGMFGNGVRETHAAAVMIVVSLLRGVITGSVST